MTDNQYFYRISDSGDKLVPGKEICIERFIGVESDRIEISALTALPERRLLTMRKESITAEQAVFDTLRETAGAWGTLAAQTLLLNMAIEYISTPTVNHTSNKWKHEENGYQSISNMVYIMSHHLREDTRYDRETTQSVPVAWYLTWFVKLNTPSEYSTAYIAGQERKRFTDKGSMERYLQGRIKAYSHLLTEISPPIPRRYIKYFCVNGQLLPGYTMKNEFDV